MKQENTVMKDRSGTVTTFGESVILSTRANRDQEQKNYS